MVEIPIMDEAAFWSIIDQFDWDNTGDDGAVLRPALNALSSMSPEDIAAFEQILAAKLYALDTREHARWRYRGQSDPDNGADYISSDDFLYSRCVIVANGRCVAGQRDGSEPTDAVPGDAPAGGVPGLRDMASAAAGHAARTSWR